MGFQKNPSDTTRQRDNETKRHLMVSNKKAITSDSFRGGRLVVSSSCCLVVSSSLGLAEKMSKKRVSKNSKSTVWILNPHDSGVSSSRCLVSLSRLVISSRCLVVSLSDQNLFFYNSYFSMCYEITICYFFIIVKIHYEMHF